MFDGNIKKMKENCFLKPSYNGFVRTDPPLTVIAKAGKRKLTEKVCLGQLICVGKVYLKTHSGLIRIK